MMNTMLKTQPTTMKLDLAVSQSLVSLIRVAEKIHILANLWYPLHDGEIVAENAFFCGKRPATHRTVKASREEFNDTACVTCTRRYAMADIRNGRSRSWYIAPTYTSPCNVPDIE